MKRVYLIITIMLIVFSATSLWAQVYNIKDFGARPDGTTINTKAIQAAIDKCSVTGGLVLIPQGVFLSGTLYLKNGVEIHIEDGGILKGSPFFKDYPNNYVNYKNAFSYNADGSLNSNKAFLFAEGVSNISITGNGTINGSGDSPEFDLGNDNIPASRKRPCMLLIVDCKKIRLNDVLLTNSAYWMENYLGCDDLQIKRIWVYNQTNYNQDGMDLDAKNVLVEDCNIDVDDDGICFKSHDRNRIPQNITVKNCNIASNCNAVKFGTMSIGGLKNVTISNCIIHKASVERIRHWQQTLKFIGQPVTAIAGIALESVDGGMIDNINISDVKINDVQTPIFIVLGNRNRKQFGDNTNPVSQIQNITLKNITATSYSKMTSSITGYPGVYVKNVHLSNIVFSSMGMGTLAEANSLLKENSSAYPENRMYGQVYPASGLFVRHVTDLIIDNMDLSVREADARPAVVLDDVLYSRLNGLKMQPPANKTAAIRLVKSKHITISYPRITTAGNPLLQLLQTNPDDVKVTGFKGKSDIILPIQKN